MAVELLSHKFNKMILSCLNAVPDAEVAHAEVQQIVDRNGGHLRPADVVEHAKPKDNPLHECFEWNDKKAGAKYREHQATKLIQAFKVVIETPDEKPQEVRAFASVTIVEDDTPQRRYMPTLIAMQNGDLRDQILAECRSSLLSWKRRFAEHASLAESLATAAQYVDEAIAAIPVRTVKDDTEDDDQ